MTAESPKQKQRHDTGAPADPAAAPANEPVGAPEHDQWLLDEALAETFPASDPISPSVKKPPAG